MDVLLNTNTILLQHTRSQWLLFENPLTVIQTNTIEDILPALREVDSRVNKHQEFAAGFISYEAAPGFDPALKTHSLPDFPLIWFGLFQKPRILNSLPKGKTPCQLGNWQPDTNQASYQHAFDHIQSCLAGGESYQVNYTIRMNAAFTGYPFGLFRQMTKSQQALYGAYIDFGEYAICSASPELFFSLNNNRLISRPMKGTTPRGRFLSEDRFISQRLQDSLKNRAENVMIVDMMRNDMGRIAIPGSVHVPHLFDVEKYPTVWQMTSTVESQTKADLPDIFQALFPCASVTGAPKPRTMEIIRELEPTPRKIYTGAIGMIGPGRRARFNVTIRTVLVNQKTGSAEYGVGGGVVWDSTAKEEYRECQIKARILTEKRPDFQLLESLLWTPETGYYLLAYHIRRLTESAEYFDYPLDIESLLKHLNTKITDYPQKPLKVRLLLSSDGSFDISFKPPKPSHSVTVNCAKTPVDTDNPFLYHKTTLRDVYKQALSEKGEADDVILWNNRDEITESSSSNIVIQFGEKRLTPPVSCGLLPGTRRAELLDQGAIKESVIHKSQLYKADRIFLINSVRPWREAVLTVQS
ncbi:aminodeoxychorismate synthase component I [bacterium]|nr:aminodeoxychorismate synthase component I [bacterium]